MEIHIIANAAMGSSLSGGDRIFIECARRWAELGHQVKIHVWEEGYDMCQRNGLDAIDYSIWPAAKWSKFGFVISYISRTLIGCRKARCLTVKEDSLVYSASDFWPDMIPALILKRRFGDKIRWLAGFYLFAPAPWRKDSPYKGKRRLRGLFYWLTQKPAYWAIKRYADVVSVTSEPDVTMFVTKTRGKDAIIVVRGGVDIRASQEYLSSKGSVPADKKIFDACFIGRLHPQKGVCELVDIWSKVCERKPDAKLAMIGDGPLEPRLRRSIRKKGLADNICMLGFKDGEEKLEIFRQSKIVVHPAIYDSGGMAACEGMACGLAGIGFDLPALKTYYPKGMIKVACFDFDEFAANILKLLSDADLYERTQQQAVELAREWDWGNRAAQVIASIEEAC